VGQVPTGRWRARSGRDNYRLITRLSTMPLAGIRLRPEHRNHVWSYNFVEERTHNGRKYRMLNVLDEFTHECLAIRVARKLKAIDVIDVLSDLFILRGIPAHSGPTTDRSSSPRHCRNGSRLSVPKPLGSRSCWRRNTGREPQKKLARVGGKHAGPSS
jgi:hypothetical protein